MLIGQLQAASIMYIGESNALTGRGKIFKLYLVLGYIAYTGQPEIT